MVLDVHARELPVPATEVGALLDRLCRPDDPLWPVPAWPPVLLSGPLAPGVAGGHGPIGDTVTGYEPGCSVEFAFTPGVGLHGTHTLSIEPARHDRCVLRHVLAVRLRRSGRVTWLVVRWLHDAVVEDLLDRAESSLGVGPARPGRLVLRSTDAARALASALAGGRTRTALRAHRLDPLSGGAGRPRTSRLPDPRRTLSMPAALLTFALAARAAGQHSRRPLQPAGVAAHHSAHAPTPHGRLPTPDSEE